MIFILPKAFPWALSPLVQTLGKVDINSRQFPSSKKRVAL